MPGPGAKPVPPARPALRLDKWLWHARFFRTRSLATDVVAGGDVRLNGQRVAKAAQTVAVGDVLTFMQFGRVRLVRVTALSERRGPATVAQRLYLDLDAPDPQDAAPSPLD